jgi:hypothetical protein
MTLRRWTALIITAYVILAVGAVVSLYLFQQQQEDIKDTNDRLTEAAIAYCQAGIQPDVKEKSVLEAISLGNYHPKHLDPICERIKERIEEDITRGDNP